MGLFDDLLPEKPRVGLFSDLLPKVAPSETQPQADPNASVGSPGFLGGVADYGRGLGKGVISTLPEQIGKAAQFFGAEETGKQLREFGEEQAKAPSTPRQSLVGQGAQEGSALSLRGGAFAAGENTPLSSGPGLAGAVTGGALGSVAGPAGTIAGAGIGYLVGSLAAMPVFYGSQGQESTETIEKGLIAKGMDPAKAKAQAREGGHLAGAVEAGGELFADLIPAAKLAKPFLKLVAGALIKSLLGRSVGKAVKNVAQIEAGEISTEMAQQAAEREIESRYGAQHEGATWKDTASVIAPTFLMALLPGGLTVAHNFHSVGKLRSALQDPKTDAERRIAAASVLVNQTKEVNPTVSLAFSAYASDRIAENKPVELGDDQLYLDYFRDKLRGSPDATTPVPPPVTPSQKAGIDSAAGPLSEAAATALDTGATQDINQTRAAPVEDAALARQEKEIRAQNPDLTDEQVFKKLADAAAKERAAESTEMPDFPGPAGPDAYATDIERRQTAASRGAGETAQTLPPVRALPFATPEAAQAAADARSKRTGDAFAVVPHPYQHDKYTITPTGKKIEFPKGNVIEGESRRIPDKPAEATNAIQEQGPGGLLQHQPDQTGEGGGQRGRVEQGVQGAALTAQGGPQARLQQTEGEKIDAQGQTTTEVHRADATLAADKETGQGAQGRAAQTQGPLIEQATPAGAAARAVARGIKNQTDAAAHEAATSPTNGLPEPSLKQKETGGYKKGRFNVGPFKMAIENPEASQRSNLDTAQVQEIHDALPAEGLSGKGKARLAEALTAAKTGDYVAALEKMREASSLVLAQHPEQSAALDKIDNEAWASVVKAAHYGYAENLPITKADKGRFDFFVKPGTPEDHAGPVYVIDQKKKDGSFDETKTMAGYANQAEAIRAYKANYPKGWDRILKVTQATPEQYIEWAKTGDTRKPFAARVVMRGRKQATPKATNAGVRLSIALRRMGGIDITEASDIIGETGLRARRMMPGVFATTAKNTVGQVRKGHALSTLVHDGRLNAYLPPSMRNSSDSFDEDASTQYIRDLLADDLSLKSGLPYEERMQAEYEALALEQSGYNDLANDEQEVASAVVDEDALDIGGKVMSNDEVEAWLNEGTKDAGESVARGADASQESGQEPIAQPAQRGPPALDLVAQTNDEALAEEARIKAVAEAKAKAEKDAEDRAKADVERDSFALSGSDRTADTAAARGQGDLLAAPAEQPATPLKPDVPEGYKKVTEFYRDNVLVPGYAEFAVGERVRHTENGAIGVVEGYVGAGPIFSTYVVNFPLGNQKISRQYIEAAPPGFADTAISTLRGDAQGVWVGDLVHKGRSHPFKVVNKRTNRANWYVEIYNEGGVADNIPFPAIKGMDTAQEVANKLLDYVRTDNRDKWTVENIGVKHQQLHGAMPEEIAAQVEAIVPAKPEPGIETKATGKGETIADFGEKIGGARKDIAKPLGPRAKMSREVDARPAWARPYVAMEQIDRSRSSFPMRGDATTLPVKTGKWELMRAANKQWERMRAVGRASNTVFDTEEEALAAIPLAEVARKHRTYSYKDEDENTKFGIFRIIGDRKRAMVKGGFATDEDAMKYLVSNAVEVIEHKFTFPEKPWLDHIERTGKERRKGDISTKAFQDDFGFRGGEFGNWNMGSDGQAALNHAYDALHDLADTIGVPPKALSLNGELAIAFGARGTGGKDAARAQYEPGAVVINLTKIKGAGSLAHEWFHALDDYLKRSTDSDAGRLTRKVIKEERPYATYGFGTKSTARPELIAAFKRLVDTMMTKTDGVAINEEGAKRGLNRAEEALKYRLDSLRQNIARRREYGRKKEPATPELLEKWDALVARALAGDRGAGVHIPGATRRSPGYQSSEVVRGLNAIYKAVMGYSFDRADPDSEGRRLHWNIGSIADMNKRVADAQAGTIEERLSGTEFLSESKKIDELRASPYWATKHEMGARAFESYIFDKLTGAEKRSDYLVHAVENKYYALFGQKPYPEGAERQAINAAFDNLFDVIETKETDRGVAVNEEKAAYDAVIEHAKSDGYQQDPDLSLGQESAQVADRRKPGAAPATVAPGTLPAARPFVVLRKTGEVVRTGFPRITTAEQAAHVFAGLRKQPREWFTILMTDAVGKPTGIAHAFKGALAETSVYPGEILKIAHATPGTKTIWIAHNHPSGIAVPSVADERLTEIIRRGYDESFGIKYAGHVIIAGTHYTSIEADLSATPKRPIPAKARTEAIPVVDRIVMRAPSAENTLSSPLAAKAFVEKTLAGAEAGIVWLSSQNNVLAVDPMAVDDMKILRGGGFAELMKRWSEVNASGLILKVPDDLGGYEAARNLFSAFGIGSTNIRLLDVLAEGRDKKLRSLEGSGERPSSDGPVYSLGESVPGNRAPTFYSALQRGIEKAPFSKSGEINRQEFVRWLDANAGKLSIKKDEIEWSGLKEFITLGDGKITRDEINDYLNASGVTVEETVLGATDFESELAVIASHGYAVREDSVDESPILENDDGSEIGDNQEVSPAVLAAFQRIVRADRGGTKYAAHQLPGGENYRELLLTLPSAASDDKFRALQTRLDAEPTTEGRVAILREREQLMGKRNESFSSSHFDQPNILAHIRFNERTDTDGKRVLFIEELQSDWAQKGRKEGFAVSANDKSAPPPGTAIREWTNSVGRWFQAEWTLESGRAGAASDKYETPQQAIDGAWREAARDRPPAAPFVGKTEAWVALALKRMIRYAADNGFDSITWANGAQQADRYDLSKQVDALRVDRLPKGNFHVEAKTPGNRGWRSLGQFDESALADNIGKELAERASKLANGERAEYAGLDLKVGWHGMRAFYDKIVPQVANNILKKVDGGRVGVVTVDVQGRPETGTGLAEVLSENQGFDITDEMRNAVVHGLPLFSTAMVPAKGMTTSAVRAALSGLRAKWQNAPGIKIVRAAKDLPFDAPDNARGAFHGGLVYLVAGNLATPNEVLKVILHETAGHYGLRGILGNQLDGVMQRIYDTNADIRADADARIAFYAKHNVPLTNAEAVEEVLADLAAKHQLEGVPGWKFLVAAIRNALRKVGFDLEMTEADVADLLRQARKYVEVGGKPRTPSIATGKPAVDAQYSLAAAGWKEAAVREIYDTISSPRQFNWLHRRIATQFHKAQINDEFRPVFEAAQRFIQDTAAFAHQAADLAGEDMLPRLGRLSDAFRNITKTRQINRDIKAAGKATWAATLGDILPTQDMLREGFTVTAKDEAGVIGDITVEPLTDAQITYYNNARAAIDLALDQAAVSEMSRMVKGEGIGADIMEMAKADAANGYNLFSTVLHEQAAEARVQGDEETAGKKESLIAQLDEAQGRVTQLKEQGYAPLMRFGQYTVRATEVRDGSTPTTLFFGMFETVREANRMRREMQEQYPNAVVTTGTMDEESWKLYRGLSLDSLEAFAQATGLRNFEPMQEFLKVAVSTRSAMKRLIHRKGIQGYDEDLRRVLAGFITSQARLASRNYHFGEMTEAHNKIDIDSDVRNESAKLINYLQNPIEEASAIRGLLFVNFIGGSVASALTNTSQPIMMTLPFLSQFGGPARAMSALKDALAVAGGAVSSDPALRAAMETAAKQGITEPQELHQLYAESIRGMGSNLWTRKGLRVWGSMFSVAESFNRRITFAAAFQMANTPQALAQINEVRARRNLPTFDSAFDFAESAVEDTQGIYNRGNRPNWGRGPIGATLFTFKQFTIAYIEFLARLPAKERALAMGILVLAAGLQGAPGADDLENLIDTIGQLMGYNTNSKKVLRERAVQLLGESVGGLLTHGISGIPGMPIDIQGRLGVRQLIPFSGAFKRSEVDKADQISQAVGPIGGLFIQAQRGFDALEAGDVAGFFARGTPVAIQNALKGFDMWQSGVYKDTQGRKVMDVTPFDALVKSLGIQPQEVAIRQRRESDVRQNVMLARKVESELVDRMARGMVNKDNDAVRSAQEDLAKWNLRNPETPIRITLQQVRQRAIASMVSREARTLKATPRELRPAIIESLRS